MVHKTPKGSIPTPVLLAFYSRPTRVLLRSCWHPTRLLLAEIARKCTKSAGKLESREMKQLRRNSSGAYASARSNVQYPMPNVQKSGDRNAVVMTQCDPNPSSSNNEISRLARSHKTCRGQARAVTRYIQASCAFLPHWRRVCNSPHSTGCYTIVTALSNLQGTHT